MVPPARADDDRDIEELWKRCTRWLAGHGRRRPAEMLATIPEDTEEDRYGDGGIVTALEEEIAGLLGKPAALFLPTGTMAQQATLRVHGDQRKRNTVVWHPACHLDWREERGYQRLHHLVGVAAGDFRAPLTLAALEQVAEPPAALLLELPQRDLGGTLPEWGELEGLTSWAREKGAAVHMDGARLWEATPYYQRSPAEIAAGFDTAYVSFYKGLGAISGCCVAGADDVIAQLSQWRTRHGGRMFAMWPYAAAARTALGQRLPKMPDYYRHARAIAAAMGAVPGVRVQPEELQAPMMHLQLAVGPDDLRKRAAGIAEDQGIATFLRPYATDGPGLVRVELPVGDSTLTFTPAEVASLVALLVAA
jgi:threonine aldolase